mmetsp:Transcript_48493/g.137083  ORF Transcript_48493/g.137083 Transcript_48493/m.137083 type:complete len:210 (-) Transcript_48493:887-1516(-)
MASTVAISMMCFAPDWLMVRRDVPDLGDEVAGRKGLLELVPLVRDRVVLQHEVDPLREAALLLRGSPQLRQRLGGHVRRHLRIRRRHPLAEQLLRGGRLQHGLHLRLEVRGDGELPGLARVLGAAEAHNSAQDELFQAVLSVQGLAQLKSFILRQYIDDLGAGQRHDAAEDLWRRHWLEQLLDLSTPARSLEHAPNRVPELLAPGVPGE